MSTREPRQPQQPPSLSSTLPSAALPPSALPPPVGIGPRRSRGRHEREFHAAMRRVWALPLAHQHEVAATLIEFLGGPLGTEPAVRDQVRRRAEALVDLRRAIDWLGLPEGKKPKGHEYDRAADALGLMSRSVVIKAWEKWDNAQRAVAGEWIPLTPAQRALKRATSGRKRSRETYFAGIRKAVMDRGSQDADQVSYDEFVLAYNDELAQRMLTASGSEWAVEKAYAESADDDESPERELPLVHSDSVMVAFPGLKWHEVVMAAFGLLDPVAVMRQRAEEAVVAAREAHGLVGVEVVAGLLAVSKPNADGYTRSAEFPKPVTQLGNVRVWEADDVRAYAAWHLARAEVGAGAGAPPSYSSTGPLCRMDEFCDTAAVATMLGMTPGSIVAALYLKRTSVPQPAGHVAGRHYWMCEDVTAWKREREAARRR